jgi:hypothetical protein
MVYGVLDALVEPLAHLTVGFLGLPAFSTAIADRGNGNLPPKTT